MEHTGIRQLEVLKYIYEQVELKDYLPTAHEAGKIADLSPTSTVHGHLVRPEEEGLILHGPTGPRATELTPEGLEKIRIQLTAVPMLGVVTAGEPILAVEEASDFSPLPPDLRIEGNTLFTLTVRGESMTSTDILDGDQMIAHKQLNANNSDVVITMIDEDEATYERFFREVDHIHLWLKNGALAPILLDDVTVLGRVIGLCRNHIQ